jgi:pimeloyl-ACP methyl ester carboxylesterase
MSKQIAIIHFVNLNTRMKFKYLSFCFFLFSFMMACQANDKGSYTISSSDGLDITLQAYLTDDLEAPFILLCHQAGWSRGEYTEIAPQLNEMGYNCIAMDQRSGGEINGVKNETYERAAKKGLSTKFVDAVPDIETVMTHIIEQYEQENIILWGSSYSSSIVLYLATVHPDIVHSVLSFAPGDYFMIDDKHFSEYAKKVTVPVFMTSARNEKEQCTPIFEAIPGDQKSYYLPEGKGYHGSRALWKKHEGNELYWEAVIQFLTAHD